MRHDHRTVLILSAFLALAASSCAPSPRISRSTERTPARDKAEKTSTPDEDLTSGEADAERAPPVPGAPATADEKDHNVRSPRDAKAVARRALVLQAVGRVALSPRANENATAASMEKFDAERERIIADLKKEGLWGYTTRNEKVLLSTPVGTKSLGRPIEASEAGECLMIMLWALGNAKRLPEFDTSSPGITRLSEALPEQSTGTAEFLGRADLRARGEIEHAKERAWYWDWRAQVRKRMAEGKFLQGEELDKEVQELDGMAHQAGFRLGPIRDGRSFYHELIRFTSFSAAKSGLIAKPIQDDFPVKGKSYADLPESESRRISLIAARRLHALEWILGERASWDAPAEKG